MRNIKTSVFKLTSAAVISFILVFPGIAWAVPGDSSTWTVSGNSLPAGRSLSVSATYNDFVYIMGGWDSSNGTNTVYYAPLSSDGSVGTWTTNSNSLPVALRAAFGLAHNGYMYVMGGLNNSNARLSTIYYAPINENGSLGTWSTNATPLPTTLQQSMTVARDGYIYVMGGYNGSHLTTVRYAPINEDGSIGSWTINDTALTEAKAATDAVVLNDRVYLVGGLNSSSASTDTVLYAGFDSDHSMGTWASTTSLPDDRSSPGVAASNGYIYLTGGAELGTQQNDVYSARVRSDGTIAAWASSPNTISPYTTMHASVAHNSFLYVIGGTDIFNAAQTQVAYAEVTPPVTTAVVTNPVTSKPVSIDAGWGTDLTCSSATQESSLSVQDASYNYPVGLASFCYDTDASSNEVTVVFVTDLTPSQVVVRHYNSTTGTYTTVPGAVVTATTYNSQAALQVVYTITDDGSLDTNSTTGSVTDPVGLGVLITASQSAITTPNTGLKREGTAHVVVLMVTGAVLVASALYGRKRSIYKQT